MEVMLPELSSMNRMFGFAAVLAAGFESNNSTSSAIAGDPTIDASISPAPAQATRILNEFMCPFLSVVNP
jgi:hypothetical protein